MQHTAYLNRIFMKLAVSSQLHPYQLRNASPLFRFTGLLALLLPLTAAAQTPAVAPADTTHKYQNHADNSPAAKKTFFHSEGFRPTIIPALLIGYGANTINGNSLYSSYDLHNDVRHVFGGYRKLIDDFLQWSPYLEIPAGLPTCSGPMAPITCRFRRGTQRRPFWRPSAHRVSR